MASTSDRQSAQLQALADRYQHITGEQFFLYSTHPGDGQHKYVFQDAVVVGLPAALAHMITQCHKRDVSITF